VSAVGEGGYPAFDSMESITDATGARARAVFMKVIPAATATAAHFTVRRPSVRDVTPARTHASSRKLPASHSAASVPSLAS